MFRILPHLIIILALFFGLKLGNIFDDINNLTAISTLHAASAEEQKKPEESSEHKEDSKAKDEHGAPAKEDSVIPMGPNLCEFSPTEVEILQALKKRREELEKRENEIKLKENMLLVLGKNVDSQITSLTKIQGEVKVLLDKYNEKRSHEISVLVKIYENMKPKDAARIFDTLELDILLEVASNMKEVRLAQVLAMMSPEKAKSLTVEIANHSRIKS